MPAYSCGPYCSYTSNFHILRNTDLNHPPNDGYICILLTRSAQHRTNCSIRANCTVRLHFRDERKYRENPKASMKYQYSN